MDRKNQKQQEMQQLGLSSKEYDKLASLSNQFAAVGLFGFYDFATSLIIRERFARCGQRLGKVEVEITSGS